MSPPPLSSLARKSKRRAHHEVGGSLAHPGHWGRGHFAFMGFNLVASSFYVEVGLWAEDASQDICRGLCFEMHRMSLPLPGSLLMLPFLPLLVVCCPLLLVISHFLLLVGLRRSSSPVRKFSRGGMGGWPAKTNYNFCRSSFLGCAACVSKSLVPPMFLPPQFPPLSKNRPAHIPVERGEAAVAASSLLRELEGYWLSPHPSTEGRGSWSGSFLWLGPNCGCEGEDGGRKERGWANINCDAVNL